MSLAIPIPLSKLCRLTEVSRAGFYRWQGAAPAADPGMELRDEIQRIALELAITAAAASRESCMSAAGV